ncbi:hypothetical protein ABZ791_31810 [Streptomyces huasconensis]|uniref:Uncharacterized protein n=1 Tax=Streptomyces huasconensis TaxID=1854574 RepID=A0ABV3LZ27_9ACTN
MSAGPADFVAAAAEILTTTDPSPQDRAVAALLNHLADHWRHQDPQTQQHARAVARAIREAAS